MAVVPIRMTDAWALADLETLRAVLRTRLDVVGLGLAEVSAHGPERLADPKRLLNSSFAIAKPRARGRASQYLTEIGESIPLPALRRLAAFRQLEGDLRSALSTLGILR